MGREAARGAGLTPRRLELQALLADPGRDSGLAAIGVRPAAGLGGRKPAAARVRLGGIGRLRAATIWMGTV